jgi:NitT/TauT family transport system substrate-binding protein
MLYRTLRTISLSVALLVTALTPSLSQTAIKGEGGKVRVLSFPSGNDYPFWLIAKLGIDKKYGFDLENIAIQPGGAVMTAFRSGATEGGLMNWLEVARARTNGDQVSAVVPFLEMPNVWVVPKDSPAKDIAGLKGMKIGTYNRFSPEWILYLATARDKAGYDPKVDSTIQEAGPGLLRGLLDQKQIEAGFIFYNLAMPMVATASTVSYFPAASFWSVLVFQRQRC